MKIVTDCAADMTIEEAKELGVIVAPLYIQFPEGELNSDDLTVDEFFDRLKKMAPEIPTTALPSSETFRKIYTELEETDDEILSIHISSGLSSTVNAAIMAASELKESLVKCFDTLTLSGGQRFHVLAAYNLAKAGWSREAIIERLEQIRAKTEVIYTLDTLTYLARGGRIGRVQALAGMLLHIKPIITVEHSDGKYSTVGKTRTINQALEMITNTLSGKFEQTAVWVSIVHGQFAEQAEALAELLRKKMNIQKLEFIRVSPVLGVHTGPGLVGATVAPYDLMGENS